MYQEANSIQVVYGMEVLFVVSYSQEILTSPSPE